MASTHSTQQQKARRAAWWVGVTVALMVGLAYASVPLYRMFCQVTGFAGTPKKTAAPGAELADKTGNTFTVRFNADIDPKLPWEFRPQKTSVTVTPGEPFLAFFEATNTGSEPITGTATFNVTPLKTGKYFNKIECFCFQEQTLKPGEHMLFPVSFWVDPKITTDKNTQEVDTVTLSYTFFRKVENTAMAR